MTSRIKYADFLKERKIPTFPIKLWFEKTDETLSDGSKKIKKNMNSDTFGHPDNVIDFYGRELGEYLMEHNLTLKNKKALKENPELLIRKIIPKMIDFDMPKKLLKRYIKCRWASFNNGNRFKYSHFAVDTNQIGIVDVDMELPEDSPIYTEMLNNHPYKKSTTKKFGRHIIFNREDIPHKGSRHPDKFKKWGCCENGEAGIEFLDGLWEWAKITDEIEQPEKGITKNEWFMNQMKSIITNNQRQNRQQGETKTSREPTQQAPPIPIANAVLLESQYPLLIIQDNLARYSTEHLTEVSKASGVIISFASSGCEQVYQLVLKACKRQGANFSNEEWVRGRWNSYDTLTHQSYKERFDSYWCVKYKEQFNWKAFMRDSDKMVQERFLQNHQHNFIINTDYKREPTKLCYFDEKECLWSHDPKSGIGKSIIRNLLMNERQYWEETMEESIEGMPDKMTNAAGQEVPNEFKLEAEKAMWRHLKQYHSTGGWLSGTIKNIYNMLLYNFKLRTEVCFNLMPMTKHLFQFKNGAFNLRTGGFEPRTRDMYITNDGILKYDYPVDNTDEEIDTYLKEKTDIIKVMIEQIIPNKKERDAWYAWRGYTLTGEINAQMFFLYLGAGANNGKSTLCEIQSSAFPCYCKKINNDAVIDKTKDDKTLSSLVNRSYRLVYVEEIAEIGLKVKELTADVIPVKPLYMEEMDLIIQFKLEAPCNEPPKVTCDAGVLRRARQQEFNSQFVDDENDVDEPNNIYLKDPNLGMSFKMDEEMKIALFRLFAKESKKYYDNGVNEWKKQFEDMRQAFAETNQEDDTMNDFIKNCFVVEQDSNISKAEMLQYLYTETDDEFIKTDGAGNIKYKKSSLVINEFKKNRYKYDSQMRVQGIKGFFLNIKYVGNNDDDE